jgi:hypothetical protein
MGVEETIQQRMRQLGWSQGFVFDGALKDALVSNATERFSWADEADSLILISQDCDLLHHCLENEPFVEFLCAKSIEKSDVSFVHGKNPRRLQVQDAKGGWLDVQMSHRIRIPRNKIGEGYPISEKKLSKESLSILVSWLSKRYSRPAFPDHFNEYLSSIKHLDDKLTNLNESYPLIKRFFFYLDPFSEADVYRLEIRVLLQGSSSDVVHERAMKETIEEKVEKLFSGPHIGIANLDYRFQQPSFQRFLSATMPASMAF